MRGLFARALGEDWDDLHPRLRDRYGLVASDGRQAIGRGQMDRIDCNTLAAPMLRLFAYDDLLVPEGGTDVPFVMTTTPFVDSNGNEALFLHRQFDLDPPRLFVDTLRFNPARDCLTDILGRRGRLAVDISLSERDGALELTLGTQWLRVGGGYRRLPDVCGVDGRLVDWYDDDAAAFVVAARVTNPLVGTVFGYEGRFENDFRELTEDGTVDRSHSGTPLPGGSG